MSLLDVGKSCVVCSTVDFLPFICPRCSRTLCRNHVQSHACDGESAAIEENPVAGPSSFTRKTRCEVKGCEKASIEAIGGREGEVLAEDEIAREVRCHGCSGAYCSAHRSQTAHACSAPLDYTARNDALTERRARARELIAQKFPDRKDRVIPKPPPQRDVVKARPLSPDRLPPSLQPASPPGQQIDTKIAAAKPVKTKADKMRELHVRKLRSLATPLDPKMRADGERRFFEWSVGSKEDAETWRTSGKSSWKLSKVWVPQDIPVGKILDLMIDRAKVPRPKSNAVEEQLKLICLFESTVDERAIQPIASDWQASKLVEGSIVLLVKGWS